MRPMARANAKLMELRRIVWNHDMCRSGHCYFTYTQH